MSRCDDCIPEDLTHTTAGYRRALWTVVMLNAGSGLVELTGGFLAGSQELKADALDFLGDGGITFLALLALRKGQQWRARAALLQGLFLGLLGVGVLIAAGYRVLVTQTPEPVLMGGFGIAALIVNVAAAMVLMKHREGDSGVRAVWLFSRNDAIGNAAVIAAAGLVWATGNGWPDLIVAAGIAALFLHGAWDIVKDARGDLKRNTA